MSGSHRNRTSCWWPAPTWAFTPGFFYENSYQRFKILVVLDRLKKDFTLPIDAITSHDTRAMADQGAMPGNAP